MTGSDGDCFYLEDFKSNRKSCWRKKVFLQGVRQNQNVTEKKEKLPLQLHFSHCGNCVVAILTYQGVRKKCCHPVWLTYLRPVLPRRPRRVLRSISPAKCVSRLPPRSQLMSFVSERSPPLQHRNQFLRKCGNTFLTGHRHRDIGSPASKRRARGPLDGRSCEKEFMIYTRNVHTVL